MCYFWGINLNVFCGIWLWQTTLEQSFRDAAENTKELRTKLGAEQTNVSKTTTELLGNIWALLDNGAREISKAINEKASA